MEKISGKGVETFIMADNVIFKTGNIEQKEPAKVKGQVLFSVDNAGKGEIYFDKDGNTRIRMGGNTAEKLEKAQNLLTYLNSNTAAPFDGSLGASIGVTGILGVSNGGTGKDTLASGEVLVGNGTAAVTTKKIDTSVTSDSTNLITSGGVYSYAPKKDGTGASGNWGINITGSAGSLSAKPKINGTAFDGTEGITTANWGPVVSFTTTDGTNTSDAVTSNGSSAVDIKLPSTIKANLSGKATSAGTADSATTATTATTCTGNAATATKLATGFKINGSGLIYGNEGASGITTATWGPIVSFTTTDGTNTSDAVTSNGQTAVGIKLPSTIKATLDGKASTAGVADSAKVCTGNAATATTADTAKALEHNVTINLTGNVTGKLDSCNFSDKTYTISTSLNVNYAGSSSKGGAATSALKLVNSSGADYSLGSTGKPVYFSNGIPVECEGMTNAQQAIPYIVGPATDTTTGTWTGTHDSITALADGLTIIYVPAVAGGSSTTTLNINGLGAKTCYLTNTTKLTTHFSVGTPIMLTYIGGTWKRADYNSDNKVRQYLTSDGTTAYPILFRYNTTAPTNSGKYLETYSRFANTITATAAGTLTAVNFVGNLSGNVTGSLTGDVTGNVSGSSGSCTGNAATATKLVTGFKINGSSLIYGNEGANGITTATWGPSVAFKITDADASNSGTEVTSNGGSSGGNKVTLALPSIIKATLRGKADTAGHADTAGSATTAASCTGNAATASKWLNGVKFGIASAATGNKVTVVGDEGTNGVSLELPKTITDLTSINADVFNGNLSGTATNALNLTDTNGTGLTVGDENTPIYFKNGVPVALTGVPALDVKVANAEKADRWKDGVAFKISDTAVNSVNGTTVYGDEGTTNGVTLALPKSLKGFTSIEATTFSGKATSAGTADNATNATNATTASKLGTTDIGGATVPIYLDNGVPKACTSISLNAATASKWVSKMTLKLSGAASTTDNPTSVSFNGEEGTSGVTLNMPKAITGFTEVSSAKVVLNEGTTNRMYFQYNATNESCEFVFV